MNHITVEAYLMGRIKPEELTPQQTENMNTLLTRVNALLDLYKRPLPVNSGYRSPGDQARINPKAPHSKHIDCAAIDLGDRDHNFRYWVLMRLDKLAEIGLWLEDPAHTPTWIHVQCIPPKSGYRIFIP